MKKILSFLLALALLIGIIPMSFAGAATLTDAVKSNYSIETTLSDGIIQKTAKRTFFVIAKDGDGNKVTPTATFNGDALSPTWDDATQTSFTLNFTVEGENTVVVSAGDAELTYTITYQPAEDGEYVGQAIFSIEAFSLGEGYIVEPVLTDIYAGDCAAAVLMRVLNRFGFTESHTGSVEGGFYLATIKDGTIPNIPVSPVNAPAELVDALSSWGITLEDRYSENELGEFDYCYASGWMYCLNNVFPNVGFSDSYLSDGDVVRVQFTVAYGSDIGGGYAMVGIDNTSFYPVANKDRLSTLIATLNEHGIEIPDSAMNAATAIYASQEDVNAAAAVLQQLEDEYQQNAPVRDVIAKISAIGEVSLESASAIAEARQAYDALTAEQQALVSNYDVLTAAEETLRTLIEELPVSASFSAPEITALSGQQVEIPVTVSGKFEAHTLEMHIGYDSTKLTVNEVVPGAILENTSMNVIDFTTTPGTIYVGALCADAPMTGNGIDENVLLTVKATVNPEFSGTTPVNVDVNRFVNLPVGGTVTDIEVHTTNGSVNASLPEYTLTYTVNGEFYAEQTYAVGAVITVPEYTVPEGYTFSGWVVPETMPAEDLTVDAVLSINVFTVTFVDRLDGSVIAEVSVEHGSNVTAPAAPAHDGYVFTGWNGSLVNVTENRTVTAEYSLLGDVDGDGVVTSADALTVLRMSLGIIATPVSGSLDFSICDIDGSGDITSVDALLIIRKAMQSA